MQKTMSDEQARKKLKISSWRDMPIEKIPMFLQCMGKMDPQVVCEAISQFPRFADMCETMLDSMNNTISDILKNDTENARMFYGAYNQIIDTLSAELHSDNISEEEKNKIIDDLMKIADKLYEMESNSSKRTERIAKNVIGGILGIAGLVGSVATYVLLSSRDENDSNSDEKEVIPDDEYPSDDED